MGMLNYISAPEEADSAQVYAAESNQVLENHCLHIP